MDANLRTTGKKAAGMANNIADAETPRVLLVDDSKTIRLRTESILNQYGCHTITAVDGFDALCKIGAANPHLVLMDGMMPRLDGFQACALIRHSEKYAALPVVLVSSNDGLLEKTKAELVGAQRYIVKPFRREDILQALRDFLPQVCVQEIDQTVELGVEHRAG